jgi:hypothetical protein
MEKQLMIGGQALRTLGSTRFTADTDYLVCVKNGSLFFHDKENNVDYINAGAQKQKGENANAAKFFAEIWKMEKNNNSSIASVQAIAELKAYSLIQNCLNGDWKKADEAEFDLNFLKSLGATLPTICAKYVTSGQFSEIAKIFSK